jgi:hypothetical protein
MRVPSTLILLILQYGRELQTEHKIGGKELDRYDLVMDFIGTSHVLSGPSDAIVMPSARLKLMPAAIPSVRSLSAVPAALRERYFCK